MRYAGPSLLVALAVAGASTGVSRAESAGTGIRVSSSFDSVLLLREDTPLNTGLETDKSFETGFNGSVGLGLLVSHSRARLADFSLGLFTGYQARNINSLAIGPQIRWCPQAYIRPSGKKTESWCPAEVTLLANVAQGSYAQFTGALTSARFGTRFERSKGSLTFSSAVGLGYESYRRADRVTLIVGSLYGQVGLGTEF